MIHLKSTYAFIFLLGLVPQISYAQLQFDFKSDQKMHLDPHQEVTLKKSEKPTSLKRAARIFTRKTEDKQISAQLSSTLKNLSELGQQQAVSCSDKKSFDYALGLTVLGRYQDCRSYAEKCMQESEIENAVLLQVQGARCSLLDYQFSKANDFFLFNKNGKIDDLNFKIFLHASMALETEYSDQFDQIISNLKDFSDADKKTAKAMLEFFVIGTPKSDTKAAVYSFMDRYAVSSSGFLQQYFKSLRVALLAKDSLHEKAYSHLVEEVQGLENPLDWWDLAYNITYRLSTGGNFNLAREVYLAFYPYSHSRSLKLPLEQNTYTYTEISESACAKNMLSGSLKDDFNTKIQNWKNGTSDLKNLIADLENDANLNSLSDAQSTLGGLYSVLGDEKKARDAFWRAHQLCPFNNRSHWGLTLLERQLKYKSYADFEKNEQRVIDVISKINFPDSIYRFIPNLKSFPQTSIERVKYGMRIWADYVDYFLKASMKAYIKLPFEKLSEVASFEHLKDVRIGPPLNPNHKYDNRLWDDVRGSGGKFVAADHDEVFMGVHGDYNLLGHEMAHQFHTYVLGYHPAIGACIKKLYSAALERNIFADSYAKSNDREYFAQGVTYYLIPADMPSRYGLNQSWAIENDPHLHQLVLSIDNAKGDFSKIKCPIL
ncbi:MAG: hypothetical protein V4596_12320 [Bdellovibrionota bacterium]